MRRIQHLLLLSFLASLVAAASAPTFCKCTCFTNSTIIQLGPHHDVPAAANPPANGGAGSGGGNSGDQGTSSSSSTMSATTSTASQQSAVSRSPLDLEDELELSLDLAGRAPSSSSSSADLRRRAASSSCAQCNKAFCLKYMNLPICKGAEEKDVMTMCFQRDSRKDQIIVWAFILGTAGLLGWAGVRRVLEIREGTKLLGGGGGQHMPARGNGRTVGDGGGAAPGGLFRRTGSGSGGGGEGERTDAAGRGQYSHLADLDGEAGRS